MKRLEIPKESYLSLLGEIKERIRSAQLAALRSVNRELIDLYWDIGRLIAERQQGETWGRGVVESLAADLRAEFPGVSGFSAATCGESGPFTRNTATTKNSHHWCEKLAGQKTW